MLYGNMAVYKNTPHPLFTPAHISTIIDTLVAWFRDPL